MGACSAKEWLSAQLLISITVHIYLPTYPKVRNTGEEIVHKPNHTRFPTTTFPITRILPELKMLA